MADIVLTGDTSGAITVAAPAVAGTNTLTLPATTGNIVTSGDSSTITQGMIASGVAGTGPAFSAYLSANQNIPTSTFTKIAFNTELFDTDSNYNTGTYAFTPTVAGYYQINAITILSQVLGTAIIEIFKNGAALARGNQQTNSSLQTTRGMPISYLAYANGSSDYFEIYAYHTTGTTEESLGTSRFSYFQAYLARAA